MSCVKSTPVDAASCCNPFQAALDAVNLHCEQSRCLVRSHGLPQLLEAAEAGGLGLPGHCLADLLPAIRELFAVVLKGSHLPRHIQGFVEANMQRWQHKLPAKYEFIFNYDIKYIC